MSTKAKYVGCLLAVVAAAWSGRQISRLHGGSTFLGAAATPPLDYLAGPESFSRIENTKNTLEALSLRLRLEAEARLIGLKGLPMVTAPEHTRQLEAVVEQLRQGMEDFAGTEQEFEVAHELLIVLKSEARLSEWTEVYMRVLYERPMHPLVAEDASEALTIGRVCGQEPRVLAGLRHAAAIPMNFSGKDKITALLGQETTRLATTRLGATVIEGGS